MVHRHPAEPDLHSSANAHDLRAFQREDAVIPVAVKHIRAAARVAALPSILALAALPANADGPGAPASEDGLAGSSVVRSSGVRIRFSCRCVGRHGVHGGLVGQSSPARCGDPLRDRPGPGSVWRAFPYRQHLELLAHRRHGGRRARYRSAAGIADALRVCVISGGAHSSCNRG